MILKVNIKTIRKVINVLIFNFHLLFLMLFFWKITSEEPNPTLHMGQLKNELLFYLICFIHGLSSNSNIKYLHADLHN